MTKWKTQPLEKLVISPITYGVVKPGDYDDNDGVLFIRGGDIFNGKIATENLRTITKDVSKQYSRTLLEGGELLVSLVGNPGQVAIVPASLSGANIARQVGLVRLADDINTKFVMYYLMSSVGKEELYVQIGGSVQQVINLKDLKMVKVPLPSFYEQEAITAVLSSLDDKIDLLHRQNKTLEALAQTLFRHWFVDGTAVDWEDGCLGDLIELQYGKGLKSSLRTGEGYPVVGSSGIVDFHSEYLVEAPGIVIGRKGTLGEVIYLSANFFPIDTTYYIKSKRLSPNLYFEYFLLKTINFKDMNTDSAVPGLNRNIALATEVVIPPQSEITRFNAFAHPLFEKIQNNKAQIRTLGKIRDTLLPKLMSGEVRVRQN
jgi:type I restriction enzyme, S subunit